jgi:cellulose synthase/poly-beta-1,6-N-acetylglucosamine synthase-like glycosyltransferase
MVEVILVRYNNKECEDEAVKAVLENTTIPHHLTVFDNYPGDENLSVVWNRLIKRSDADYICLLNTDTKVSKNWLRGLLRPLEDESIGAVGPVTNKCGTVQTGFTQPAGTTWQDC